MKDHVLTESFVNGFNITVHVDSESSLVTKPNTSQHLIVSSMVNRNNLIISGQRQSGISMGVTIGICFLREVQNLKVLFMARDNFSVEAHIGNAKTILGVVVPDSAVAVEGEIADFSEWDVVVVEDFHFSKFQSTYINLRKEGKVRLILTSSHDKRATCDSLNTIGGNFDLISLVDDQPHWERMSMFQGETDKNDFLSQWVNGALSC